MAKAGCGATGCATIIVFLTFGFVLTKACPPAPSPTTAPRKAAAKRTEPSKPATPPKPEPTPAERLKDAEANVRAFAGMTSFTKDSALATAKLLDPLAMQIREIPEATPGRAALVKALVAAQVQQFPKMRRGWVEEVNSTLWKEDMSAACAGTGCRTVGLVGFMLATNRNKQQTYESLSPALYNLRFTRLTMRWYKESDEFTYYTVDSPSDRAIAALGVK